VYLIVFGTVIVTVIYVPIRPSRRDPESEELEDIED